ncbi:sterol desaturase family protein [Rhodanobacter sp. DHG33]|uniref:sterol desaturase family protein n=1 Tax=Rhodanobacter sp. DHG33 TaxID=2775921 RepID=UPI001785A883|nr:sterol desaturase family protein [Rhodanobacter sp. DHG33]MBD8897994.1 sterol desaturase family protein [Rhodanobacter sp. DHG33]
MSEAKLASTGPGGMRGTGVLQAIARMSSTRTNYWVGHAADFLVSFVLLGTAYWLGHGHSALVSVLVFLLGLLIFSFIEYAFHRWLFHGPVRLFEHGHTIHHEQPLGYDSLPFFFPPAVVLLLAAALALVLPTAMALLLTGAIALGYALYGFSHMIIHRRGRFNHPLARKWAAVHHVHHFHSDKNYGVTSPLWDFLLGTWYVSKSKVR